jgi:hypothetical protein
MSSAASGASTAPRPPHTAGLSWRRRRSDESTAVGLAPPPAAGRRFSPRRVVGVVPDSEGLVASVLTTGDTRNPFGANTRGLKGAAVTNGVSLGTLLWLIIGVVVALSNGYTIVNFSSLLSFLLAMFLWPLVLLGINLHVGLGV